MAKHAAPRTRSPFWTLTIGAVTGACIAFGTLGVTTTVEGQAHSASGYDLTHEDTSDVTCWVEKVEDVATAEGICGPRGLRPAGSVELGSEVTVNGQQWVATVTGLEPVGAN